MEAAKSFRHGIADFNHQFQLYGVWYLIHVSKKILTQIVLNGNVPD